MKKLPAGFQTFSEVIKENRVYIDKTEYLYEMISTAKAVFLSRPRRFGKSTIVSTLEALFTGRKELFKGLFIYDKWNWDESFPVIRIDFIDISYDNTEALNSTLKTFIEEKARKNNIKLINELPGQMFGELIRELFEKTGKRVVVLIDEYDKAIINNLDDINLAEDIRTSLKKFYGVLKSNDQYIKFIFITGVSKFAKTSIFSDLNHLMDITINPRFSKICGFTQDELETHFNEYINDLSETLEKTRENLLLDIKNWYNGYSWDGENFLYNPYSIINLFYEGIIDNYWADTGTPKFLVDLIKTTNVNLKVLADKQSKFEGRFPNFNLDKLVFSTVLLQTGYLTIKHREKNYSNPPIYTTGIPNKEVEQTFFKYLLASLTDYDDEDVVPLTNDMLEAIISQDSEILTEKFESIVHKLPNLIYGNIKSNFEDFLKSIIILAIHMMGFNIEAEVLTLKGRLDALLTYKDSVVIFEFKYSESESAETLLSQANNQIIEKGYYKPYINKNPSIVTVAIKSREEVICKFQSLKETLKHYENK